MDSGTPRTEGELMAEGELRAFDTFAEAQAAAARLAGVAEPQSIVLRELRWTVPEKSVPAGLPIDIAPHFSMQHGSADNLISYRVLSSISGMVPELGEIFHLDVTFQLVFSTAGEMSFDERERQAFGSTTVFFMAYPYIREVLQDTASRCGYPGILLRPLRFPIEEGQERAEQSHDASGS
jgi:preprotein translocase subunit SecB